MWRVVLWLEARAGAAGHALCGDVSPPPPPPRLPVAVSASNDSALRAQEWSLFAGRSHILEINGHNLPPAH